jgi:hypothetical protein
MPQSPRQSPSPAKPANSANPARRNVALHSATRRKAAPEQAWLVMTEWSDFEAAPHVVLTVSEGNNNSIKRTSYAAVPFANGWLFIQI